MSSLPSHLLAFDTSTERMSVALCKGDQIWRYNGAGGAAASAQLLPVIQSLMTQANMQWSDLHALVFGRGPGSFTGLRTACSVAQGLAFGANLPVLPLDTLLAVAEDARQQHGCTQVLAALDARMDQVYAARYLHRDGAWLEIDAPALTSPESLRLQEGEWLAGNVQDVYGARLQRHVRAVPSWPEAAAMLRLAPALLAQGCAVPAAQAQPLYVRYKVAQTTAERQLVAASFASASSSVSAAP